MEIYIYSIYLFFANLTKCGKPSWSGERTHMQRVSGSSLSRPRGSGLFLLLVGLGWEGGEKKKKEKKMLLKKIKWKGELSFSPSRSSLPCLPSVLPPCLLLSFRSRLAESSLPDTLGHWRHSDGIRGLGAWQRRCAKKNKIK